MGYCSSLNPTISALEMSSSAAKFRYQRLRNEGGLLLEGDHDHERERVLIVRPRNWFRFRFRFGRLRTRRRFRLKVPSLRKKVRLVSAVRLSCAKVLKRLKESQAHFGDLFAGNYLFLQINPTSLKCIDQRPCQNHYHGLDLQALPSHNYSLPRVV